MRIAIVDDIAAERSALRTRLDTQLRCRALQAEITEFENGAAFLAAAQNRRFAVVFLDIYMNGGQNGVETAKQLRRFDRDCLLIFTTASADHALEAYRVRAMHYLVKPYTDEDLAALCDEIQKRLPAPDPYIEIRTAGTATRLRLREILYAEHFQHQIHIHTADGGETVTRQTFRDFTERLHDERFFLCSRGVLINLEHAADFDGTAFLLENGQKITVSRNLTKAARAAFGEFLFKRGRRT